MCDKWSPAGCSECLSLADCLWESVWALSGCSASSPAFPEGAVGELSEVHHVAGSTGVISSHGACCRGSCWRYIGKFCIFFCAESDSRNSCVKFMSGAVLWFFFFFFLVRIKHTLFDEVTLLFILPPLFLPSLMSLYCFLQTELICFACFCY